MYISFGPEGPAYEVQYTAAELLAGMNDNADTPITIAIKPVIKSLDAFAIPSPSLYHDSE
jgi:L-arabinose isomerase